MRTATQLRQSFGRVSESKSESPFGRQVRRAGKLAGIAFAALFGCNAANAQRPKKSPASNQRAPLLQQNGIMTRCTLLLLLAAVAGGITSLTLEVPPQGTLLAGASLRIIFNATYTGAAANVTTERLVPYFDGAQYGAEVGFASFDAASGVARGEAWIPLSWSTAASRRLTLSAQGPASAGPSIGLPPPAGALLSNVATIAVTPRAPQRPHALQPGDPLLSLAWEPWFTPLNSYWGTAPGGPPGAGIAEAIPTVGRYASVGLEVLRTHAAQFVQAGVDVLLVDWTNNLWGITVWEQRQPYAQELFNATDLAFGVYAGLRAEGWDVPRFLLLLGLDNGPTTPLPALMGELDYIALHYLANASAGGIDSFVLLDGKPLVIIFDGTGRDDSGITHPSFTLRFMASQLQSTPDFARRGIWSWMDGTMEPIITLDPHNTSVSEAVTIAPAFFAGDGWLNKAVAAGRSGGLTLLLELANLLGETVGKGRPLPKFVNVCQWNEFAGQAVGSATYEDSYR